MSGPSNAQTDIVWPGYVAAMASLLLSLLLVAAVLVVTISQIGSVSESYQQAIANIGFKSRQDVDRVARLAGISEDSDAQEPELDQDGRLAKVGPESGAVAAGKKVNSRVIVDGNQKNVTESSKDALPVLDLSRAVFDPVAAREAAKLAANDKALLAQIDLSKVDVSKIKFKGIDISKIDLSRQISPADMRKIDFSQANLSTLDPARMALLKPFIAKEAIRYQLQLQRQKVAPVTLPKVVAISPPVALVPPPKPKTDSPVPQPERLQINYIEEAMEPLPAQKQQILQALAALQRQSAPIRIWTQLPNEDIYLKRTAYSRLIAMRALAVEAGFASSLVQVDIVTVPGMAVPQRDMAIFIAEQKK